MKPLIVLALLCLAGIGNVYYVDTLRAFSQSSRPVRSDRSETSASSATWAQLRQAERFTVILMRHAIAPGTGDPVNFRLDNCTTQRNLSPEGKQQAKRIGRAFRQNQIPVARVLSSQWCRCLETARLLNLGKVEQLTALNSFFKNPQTASRQTEELRQFMLKHKAEKKVVVMVTHQVNMTAIADKIPDQGDAIILQLNDQNRFEIIGKMDL
ncbi:MAG: histidine phosphatase family protein [Leptolyngbya sp. Prado105]|jgi:phosphohistidine phosphatase SixA|nr:histidine phosphatase family protein [Leptolyngbya sp. Prado105]